MSYVSLVLDTEGQIPLSKIKSSNIKKSRKNRPKKLRTYLPRDKKGISPSDLLKSYERSILLVGKPGIGKTALVLQMLKLWAEKENRELDYMFYFDMRETPNITRILNLEELLFSVYSEPDGDKDQVLQDMKKNSDSVTIIFDGVTDLPSSCVVRKLQQKDLLPDAKIIITCRPEMESADFLSDWDGLRVEVKGFDEQSIRDYLSKMLSDEHLHKVLCNVELFTLCHVPVYALMVVACFSFESSEFSPQSCTVTEIYLNILRFCIQHNTSSGKNKCLNDLMKRKRDAVLSLAEAAFHAAKDKTVNLKNKSSCVDFPFLKTLEVNVGQTEQKTFCAFLQYTLQEFFAALWVLKNSEIRGVVQRWLDEGLKHMKHLIPLMCGLLNDTKINQIESLIPAQQLRDTADWFFKDLVNKYVDYRDTEDCDLLFLCQCLYESQSAKACLYLLDSLGHCLDLSGETLDPLQCSAVSYVVSQSKERKVQLNLEDVTVSEPGVRFLLGCLNSLQR